MPYTSPPHPPLTPFSRCLCKLRSFLVLFALSVFFLSLSCGFNRQIGEPCIGTYECLGGLFCQKGQCIHPGGQGCQVNSNCPDDFVCRFKLCIARTTLLPCNLEVKCPDGFLCQEGFCTKQGEGRTCRSDIDCPTELFCDLLNGSICRLGERCEVDTDCKTNYICDKNRCVFNTNRPECTDSSECSEAEAYISGKCLPFP